MGDVAEVYHACYRRLVVQLLAFTTDLNEAQDVVQEAFARAVARPRGFAGIDNPEAWLRTVALNVARRRWRRRRVLDLILLRERPLQDHPGLDTRADLTTDLKKALDAIPRSYREVIVLHYYADLSVDEISAALNIPAGTVKSRLSRGRAALAVLLGGHEMARA
ncbi:sigma-70 family RNA polymerase sigma factor [Dactylosporangium sp. NPDC000555]|uniref:RNA polymerase sigma factor n=1 Tax=Dactylosporangium sp. NPDC000555 TaxID=3154260 RepID=UPI00332D1EE1